jgi:RepB DNA-primase from phage plasmid
VIGENVQWYRMLDADPAKGNGAIQIRPAEARGWNDKQFGIFWTLNSFNGPRRIPNLTRVNAWAVDMDAGTKAEQVAKLKRSPLVPSLVVETKRGYQAYWAAKDGRAEHWNAIVLDRLVPYFGADSNARDLARILRVPGYRHWKDPADPFQVQQVWEHTVAYSEQQVALAYPDHGAPGRDAKARAEAERADKKQDLSGPTIWDRIFAIDCEEGLRRLSGHSAVRGEKYTFKLNRTGTRNVIVDGKGSSAWVDANGRIGSLSRGGPTLYQWLRWYGNSPRDCVDVLKHIYPELERK